MSNDPMIRPSTPDLPQLQRYDNDFSGGLTVREIKSAADHDGDGQTSKAEKAAFLATITDKATSKALAAALDAPVSDDIRLVFDGVPQPLANAASRLLTPADGLEASYRAYADVLHAHAKPQDERGIDALPRVIRAAEKGHPVGSNPHFQADLDVHRHGKFFVAPDPVSRHGFGGFVTLNDGADPAKGTAPVSVQIGYQHDTGKLEMRVSDNGVDRDPTPDEVSAVMTRMEKQAVNHSERGDRRNGNAMGYTGLYQAMSDYRTQRMAAPKP